MKDCMLCGRVWTGSIRKKIEGIIRVIDSTDELVELLVKLEEELAKRELEIAESQKVEIKL